MSDQSQQPNNTRPHGYVDPNFPNPNGPNDIPVIIYGYTPSLALAVFAAVLFALSLVAHTIQVVHHRTWFFVTVTVGLAFEIVGYVARALSASKDPYNLIFFIINYFFIVTAPVFLAAGIYAVLSVLINRVGGLGGNGNGGGSGSGKEESRVVTLETTGPVKVLGLRPRTILALFVTSDVVATGTQVAGAALIGSLQSKREDPALGNNILLGGLAWQVFSMGVFCVLTGLFLFKTRKVLIANGLAPFIGAFVAATLLVYLRTCFRLAETAQGLGQELGSREVYFAVLEFAPVAAAVLLLNVWHPGRYVARTFGSEN